MKEDARILKFQFDGAQVLKNRKIKDFCLFVPPLLVSKSQLGSVNQIFAEQV